MGNHIYAGAEWIGSVPEHWKFYKGKIIFGESNEKGNDNNLELLSPTQKYGVIPQTLYEQYTTLRTVKVKEDTDLNTFKTVHKGNFCISLRSFQGGFEYSEYEGVVSPAYHILYSKCPICDGYYKYLFKEQSFIAEMNSYCQTLRDGKNISYSDFGKTLIPYPPINEQQSIANYLDDRCSKIDAIIAEAKASIEEYKELKYATISGVMQKGLESKIALKDSGINWFGKIPLDAEIVKMKNVATIVDCKNRTADNITDGEYTVIRTSCIKDGKFSLAGSYNTNEANYLEWTERGKPKIGDIFFTREAPAGEACLVPNMDNICMGQRVMYFRPHNDMDSLYILYSIYSELCRVYIDKRTKGSTVGHLKLGDVDCLPIIKRPLDEQKKISAFLRERLISIDGLVSEKQFLIEDLEAYKKSLIYEVVTGKRKVVA